MNSTDLFEAVVNEHYEALFRFAMSLTRAESDACDLTQQTFYIWATKSHQLRDVSRAKTWLFTTLHRVFLNSRQRQSRFCHYESEGVSVQMPVFSPNFANHLDSLDVLDALGKVDEVYQAAVALFYLEDYSYKDIAVILEVPIGTVKSRIARGIAQLRGILLSGEFKEPTSRGEEVALDTGTARTVACEKTPPAAKTDESDYEEWDLSATRLPEQSRMT